MATFTQRLREHGARKMIWLYANPIPNANGKVDVAIGPYKPLFVPRGVPYPIAGTPVFFGEHEGDIIQDPGLKPEPDFQRNDNIATRYKLGKRERLLKFKLFWSGDDNVIPYFQEPAQITDSSKFVGGAIELPRFRLLAAIFDLHKPNMFTYRFYYAVSAFPCVETANFSTGVDVWDVTIAALLGKNEDGCPYSIPGQLYSEFYTDKRGNPCKRNGKPIVPLTAARMGIVPISGLVGNLI